MTPNEPYLRTRFGIPGSGKNQKEEGRDHRPIRITPRDSQTPRQKNRKRDVGAGHQDPTNQLKPDHAQAVENHRQRAEHADDQQIKGKGQKKCEGGGDRIADPLPERSSAPKSAGRLPRRRCGKEGTRQSNVEVFYAPSADRLARRCFAVSRPQRQQEKADHHGHNREQPVHTIE